MKDYFVLDEESVRDGSATDEYFLKTEEILREKDRNPWVVAEVTASQRGIYCGLEEAINLLEDKAVDVYSMLEGSFFRPKQPVLVIEGNYLDFCRFETSLLGVLCHSSGVATKAAKIKKMAGEKNVLSFGTRRKHPAISLLIERSAYLGGMDGVSNNAAAERLGLEARGTMPHSLVICFGDQEEAWRSYNEVVAEDVPRIMLCDTYSDEKEESVRAAEELKDALDAIRLDTPGSRRGDFLEIIKEVRWELDARGFEDVEIFVSGNIDVEEIREYKSYVDGFGVGTSVSGADPIDFGLDIVEVEGEYSAKRGKLSGKKQVYRDDEYNDEIKLFDKDSPRDKEPLLEKVIGDGEPLVEPSLEDSRERVLSDLEKMPLNQELI